MSFFSKGNSNRRIKRSKERRTQNLLEVSTRRERSSHANVWRGIWTFLKVTTLVGVVGGVAFGGRTIVNRLVWENPSYALADIRVSTDGLLTRKQVLELCEVWEGKNIFAVDVAKARQELDALPQVERVDIRRTLPDRLEIRISERQPVAWVAASAETQVGVDPNAFLVDGRGFVMRTRKVLPEHLALPLITGLVMEDVAPGQKLPTSEGLAAVELIKLSVDDLRWQPRVVDVSKGYCLVVTDQRRARITFGFENLEGQMSRLRQLIDYVEPLQKEFQSVNLLLERNIPVVFAPPPAPAVTPSVIDPKTGKPKPGSAKNASATAQNQNGGNGGISGGVPKASAQASTQASPQDAPSQLAATAARPEAQTKKAPATSTERPLKIAKLEPSPTAPAPEREEEKPVRRKQERERSPEPLPDKPPKVLRVSEPLEKKERPSERSGAREKTESKPQPTPGSMTPSESLRKLFNPHG